MEAKKKVVEEEKKRKSEEEEEKKQQRQKEEEEKKKQVEMEEILKKKKEAIPKEPEPSDPNSCEIAFRLPSGKRVLRRFLKKDKVEVTSKYCNFLHRFYTTTLEVSQILISGNTNSNCHNQCLKRFTAT